MTRTRPHILVLDYKLSDGARYVTRHGGVPVCVSPYDIDRVEKILDHPFDGLLLMGGGDVDPRTYGDKPHKNTYGVSEVRDYTEWLALDQAEVLQVPVLGICRGSQLMAVHNGGRLKQHIGGHRGMNHPVYTERGSLLRRIIGDDASFRSLHHQAVLRHGDGWRVAARDRNDNIEAIESRDGRCLGVQFHPEMDHYSNEASRRIFRWLVLESASRAGLPEPVPVKPTSVRTAPRKPPKKAKKRGRNAVRTSWICSYCAIRFDERQDRDDHEIWIHGNPIIKTIEPPEGHPDWMPSNSQEQQAWFQETLDADSDWLDA